MADHDPIFPPKDEWDVAAYPIDEVVVGYREHRIDDPVPGPNHSPAYRWGWTNARRDVSREPDGFEGIRHAFIRMSRMKQ